MRIGKFLTAFGSIVIGLAFSLNAVLAADPTAAFAPADQLTLTAASEPTEIRNGGSGDLTVAVTNNGTTEVDAISLQAELPGKWRISQGADQTIRLKPGETGAMTIAVEVPISQAAGNLHLKISAISPDTQSNTADILVIVRTNPAIAGWMLGAAALVAGFTLIQLRKHGRR